MSEEIANPTVALGGDLTGLDRALMDAERRLDGYAKTVEAIGERVQKSLGGPITALNRRIDSLVGKIDLLSGSFNGLTAASDTLNPKLETTTTWLNGVRTSAGIARTEIRGLATDLGVLGRVTDAINNANRAAGNTGGGGGGGGRGRTAAGGAGGRIVNLDAARAKAFEGNRLSAIEYDQYLTGRLNALEAELAAENRAVADSVEYQRLLNTRRGLGTTVAREAAADEVQEFKEGEIEKLASAKTLAAERIEMEKEVAAAEAVLYKYEKDMFGAAEADKLALARIVIKEEKDLEKQRVLLANFGYKEDEKAFRQSEAEKSAALALSVEQYQRSEAIKTAVNKAGSVERAENEADAMLAAASKQGKIDYLQSPEAIKARAKQSSQFTGSGSRDLMGQSYMMASAGFALAAAGGVALYGIGELVKNGMQTEDMIKRIQATAGDTRPYEQIRKEVIAVAKAYDQMPDAVAQALYPVESAGFKGAEGMKVLANAANFAKGNEAEMGDSTELLTKTLIAFRLHASDAAEVTDIYTRAVTDSLQPGKEMVPAFANGMEMAKNAGMSVQEYSAALANMTQTTKNAATASTYLKNFMNGLINPTVAMRKEADKLHLSWLALGEGSEHIRKFGFEETIQELEKATGGKSDMLDKLFPDMRKNQAVFSLLNDGGVRFAKTLNDISNSAGSTTKASDMMNTSLEQTQKHFNASVASFASDAESILKPTVIKLMTTIEGAITTFNGMSPAMEGAIVKTTTFAAVSAVLIGALFTIVGYGMRIGAAFKSWALPLSVVTTETGELAAGGIALSEVFGGPVVWAITALVAVIAGLIYLYDKLGDSHTKTNQDLLDEQDAHLKAARAGQEHAQATLALLKQLADLNDNKGPKTKEQLDEIHDIQNKISLLSPDLVSGYDAQGNAILVMGNNAATAANNLRDMTAAAQDALEKTDLVTAQGTAEQRDDNATDIKRLQWSLKTGMVPTENPNGNALPWLKGWQFRDADPNNPEDMSNPYTSQYEGNGLFGSGDVNGLKTSVLHHGTPQELSDVAAQLRNLGTIQSGLTQNYNQSRTDAAMDATNPNSSGAIARTIIEVGQKMGASQSQILSAVETGIVESCLKNLPDLGKHNDHDSIGVFQQRQGETDKWGPVSSMTNPATAAASYYNQLFKIWNPNHTPGNNAANVQQPRADLRGRYDQAETAARKIMDHYNINDFDPNRPLRAPDNSKKGVSDGSTSGKGIKSSSAADLLSENQTESEIYQSKIDALDAATTAWENHLRETHKPIDADVNAFALLNEKMKVAISTVKEMKEHISILSDPEKMKHGKGATQDQEHAYEAAKDKLKELTAALREAENGEHSFGDSLDEFAKKHAETLKQTAKDTAEAARAYVEASRSLHDATASATGKTDLSDKLQAIQDQAQLYLHPTDPKQKPQSAVDVQRYVTAATNAAKSEDLDTTIAATDRQTQALFALGAASRDNLRNGFIKDIHDLRAELDAGTITSEQFNEKMAPIAETLRSADWQDATDMISGWQDAVKEGHLSLESYISDLKTLQGASLSPEEAKTVASDIATATKQQLASTQEDAKKTADTIGGYFEKAFDVLTSKGNRSENIRKAGEDILKEYEKKSLTDFVKKEVLSVELKGKNPKEDATKKAADDAKAWVDKYAQVGNIVVPALNGLSAIINTRFPELVAALTGVGKSSGSTTPQAPPDPLTETQKAVDHVIATQQVGGDGGSSGGNGKGTSSAIGATQGLGNVSGDISAFNSISDAANSPQGSVSQTTADANAVTAGAAALGLKGDATTPVEKTLSKVQSGLKVAQSVMSLMPKASTVITAASQGMAAANAASAAVAAATLGPVAGAAVSAATTAATASAGAAAAASAATAGAAAASIGASGATAAATAAKTASTGMAGLSTALGYVGLAMSVAQMFGAFGNGGPSKYAVGDVTQKQDFQDVFTDYSPIAKGQYTGQDGLRALLGTTSMGAAGVHSMESGPAPTPANHTIVNHITVNGNPDPSAIHSHIVNDTSEALGHLLTIDNARRGTS